MKKQGTGISHPTEQKSLGGDPGRDQGSGPIKTPEVRPILFQDSEKRSIGHRFVGPAIILFAAAVAVAPQLLRGNSCGHDFDFHLVSWFDCLNSWRHGILYPHWAPSANYGAGEPRFIFYPPLTWMLGAALGALLPWALVPIVLTFLILAATGLATRALARQAFSDGAATLAGCVALFSGYALFTAYERSAFGELTGGFWIPLLLLFALSPHRQRPVCGDPDLRDRNSSESLFKRAFDGSTALLALVVAGAWLSNAPLGVMASYLLAAVSLAAALLERSWAPVLRAAIAAVVGIGLAAVYLIPAAWEQRWADIRQATDDPGLLIENSWLFGHHANPSLALHDQELWRVSIIAVSMIALALAGLLVSRLRKTLPAKLCWWFPLALIPLIILFLQLNISLPVWNLLPKLRFLQFPWRWLVVLEAPMAIFVASAIWPVRRWSRIAVTVVCTAAFLGASVAADKLFFQVCDEEDNVLAMTEVYRTGAGFQGTAEYEPPGADDSLLAMDLPAACLVDDPTAELGVRAGDSDPESAPVWKPAQGSCEATLNWQPGTPEHKRLLTTIRDAAAFNQLAFKSTNSARVKGHSRFLILRLRSYPAWRIAVNGYPVASMPQREDGLIVVPVWPGKIVLTVDWTTTQDVLVGRWISALAMLALTALCLFERKVSRLRLS